MGADAPGGVACGPVDSALTAYLAVDDAPAALRWYAAHLDAERAVLDGATRDANAIVALGFPTFTRLVTPVFSQGRYEIVSFGEPVEMQGQVESKVRIHPGDFVIADRDGVVIVPQAILEPVLDATERLEEIERNIRAALLTGEDREAVYKRYPKFDHVKKYNSAISGAFH